MRQLRKVRMVNSKLLIEPSVTVRDPQERARAKVLAGLLLTRLLVFAILSVIFAIDGSPQFFPLVGATILNIVTYWVSRTRFYKWSALITIAEPLVMIPLQKPFHLLPPNETLFIPLWLFLGPLMSSLVLNTKSTLIVIGLTLLSFALIVFRADPATYRILYNEFFFVMTISALALMGSYLRDFADRILSEERAQLLQASKLSSLGEMAAGVAHELNSPLAAVMLGSELIEEIVSESPIDSRQIVAESRQVMATAERMAVIINGLRSFSRDSKNDARVSVPAATWVDDCLALCRNRFASHSIQFKIDRQGLSSEMPVRSVELSQVLMNLLNNSFDACSESDQKWVSIKSKFTGDFFELSVSDGGKRILPAVAERMFEPFYTTKDFGKGTGLGLSIAKGIMKSHGGDLIYNSESAETQFIMRVPVSIDNRSAA